MKLRTYVKKQHPVLQAPTKIDMEKPWNDGVREDVRKTAPTRGAQANWSP